MQFITNETQLLELGSCMAKACTTGLVMYLYGDLGAGKTSLVRGFLRGLGYQGTVKSPTYTLIESYAIDHQSVYHMDLYRLHLAQDLEEIGIRDYATEEAIFLIEWPERGKGSLPPADLECYLSFFGDKRRVEYQALNQKGRHILSVIERLCNNLRYDLKGYNLHGK